jgi:hypothetical protein
MKVQSALCFAVGTFGGGLVGELWSLQRNPSYSPELGFGVAVMGLAVFAGLWAVFIYTYGYLAQAYRNSRSQVKSYALAATCGVPFWFLLLPTHQYLRDRIGFPDAIWTVEAAVICAASFELLRVIDQRITKTSSIDRTP